MKPKTKAIIWGISIMILSIMSLYPLSLIRELSQKAFQYATISWAIIFLVGIEIVLWANRMKEFDTTKVN